MMENHDSTRDGLNDTVSRMASQFQESDMVTYMIYGAVVTTTRAFKHVVLKIDTNRNAISIEVELQWWAKWKWKLVDKKLALIRTIWLKKANKRAKEQTPSGWHTVVYYKVESK